MGLSAEVGSESNAFCVAILGVLTDTIPSRPPHHDPSGRTPTCRKRRRGADIAYLTLSDT